MQKTEQPGFKKMDGEWNNEEMLRLVQIKREEKCKGKNFIKKIKES